MTVPTETVPTMTVPTETVPTVTTVSTVPVPRPLADPVPAAHDAGPAAPAPADDADPTTGGRRRPSIGDRTRAVRLALWSLVVLCAGAYAASLLVPLWFELRDERLLIVTSGSMAPSFRAGDAVVLRPVADPSQLRPGQVVSFWPPGSDTLVTHRIQDLVRMPVLEQDAATGRTVPVLDEATGRPILREHLITQGDANPTRDADAVPVSRVRGVVLDVHAHWGAVLAWTHSDPGRLVLLGPPLVALAGMELASVLRGRRRAVPTADAARERAREQAREQARTRSDELVLG